MKISAALTLSCVFAVAGCQYEPTDRYERLNASFHRLAHKRVGASELLITPRPDRYDLVIKRSEYINYQAKLPANARGYEFCEDFAIIQAIDVPYGGLIIPYSKVDTVDGVKTALSTALITGDLEPSTMLAIPDELPGTPGLGAPYKLERRNIKQCFFRPDGMALE